MDADADKDFYISYTSADTKWAEWIAWQLEQEQYSTILQAWDFQPGMNFVLEMNKAAKVAHCTLVVLSPDYLNARYTQPEWADAFRRDPKSEKGALLPVRVRKCEVDGLLGSIVYIDLVDLDEVRAQETLLAGVRQERGKPKTAPGFPGDEERIKTEPQRFPGNFPHVWNIPYRRNAYFTGREDILKRIREAFRTDKTVALTQPQAISGLGGIGKTQTAVEFAYRYRNDYNYVLWVRADSNETLISDYITIAQLLQLSDQGVEESKYLIDAVKRWLEQNSDWLLILDNADSMKRIHEFLPIDGAGHIILTTRSQAVGTSAGHLEVEQMEQVDSTLLMLRRSKLLTLNTPIKQASEQDRHQAEVLVVELGGMPLALDQAGAYIEETGCGLAEYLDLYRTHRQSLLERRGKTSIDHPKSVATTWLLSFQQVEQVNPVAADLLRLCAFLDPDSIPERFIIIGAPKLGPILKGVADNPFLLNEAIEELRKFSLIQRNPESKMLSIHRLVQAVLKGNMSSRMQTEWVKRVSQAIDITFPVLNTNKEDFIQQYVEQVYQLNYLPLRNYIVRRGITDSNEIEAILQDTFIKLIRYMSSDKSSPTSIEALLVLIAKNTCTDHIRRKKR